MHQRVRAAALMAFPFCGNNSVPHAMLLSISLLFQSRVVNQSGHWPLARRCFCAVSTLLQLAWPVCSAHWTTHRRCLSQSAHHTTTSPKPCSSKLVLRAPRPLAWVFGASFTRSLPQLPLDIYKVPYQVRGPYCNVVRRRFSLPPACVH